MKGPARSSLSFVAFFRCFGILSNPCLRAYWLLSPSLSLSSLPRLLRILCIPDPLSLCQWSLLSRRLKLTRASISLALVFSSVAMC